jgi:hypothetical protein
MAEMEWRKWNSGNGITEIEWWKWNGGNGKSGQEADIINFQPVSVPLNWIRAITFNQ